MASTVSADGREEIKTSILLVDILDYVADSVRPIREGSCVFDAGHVICIGYTEKTDIAISFIGFVRQSSHPGQVPHRINLKITPHVSCWQCDCSCKAGTGRCKHIVACLLHLNRSGCAEYLTCTDNVQAWGISKAEKQAPWGARRIKELCCVSHPPKLEPTDEATREQILAESFSRILLAANHSAISKHRNGRHLNDSIVSINRAVQSRALERETVEYYYPRCNLILKRA
ncbi:uncharacterized protein LOC135698036 [Ochlerotatus camptorhynchus]|uniref:uncharacterized protein LOC135698036 n=1 Tax=Ochlerotatus camptorhynchus TaxID=644619 RepID=UPI0031E489E0